MKHSIPMVVMLAAFLALSGCGGGSSTPPGPMPEGLTAAGGERMALAAAHEAAMSAATGAIQGSEVGAAAVAGVEAMQNADLSSYTLASNAAGVGTAAYMAASAASPVVHAATSAEAQTALTDTRMYAGMTGGTVIGMESSGHVPTLAEVYSSDSPADHALEVLSGGLFREYSNNTTVRDDLTEQDDMFVSVTSMRRNSGGGYDITFRVEQGTSALLPSDPADVGLEVTVTFLPEHCNEVEEYCSIQDEDNIGFDFWTWTDTGNGGQLGLTTEWEFFSVKHTSVSSWNPGIENRQQRNVIVFGVGTPVASVPTRGQAIYNGSFGAHAYRQNSTDNALRHRYRGTLQIVANFDMDTLNGRIYSVRNRQPGESTYQSRPTSSFSITNGQISNGQFTATLTGMDSDPNTPFNESVRGFMGEIVGRFFGPNAEELGGVVSATRDVTGTDNDLNLYGYIGATEFGPAKILGTEGILAGVLRDLDTNTSVLREEGVTTTVQRTETGWTVTVGDRTVEFQETDYGSHPSGPGIYVRTVDGGEAWFATQTGGFGKNPEFNHFDVKGWSFTDQVSEGIYSGVSTNDRIVHGDRTPGSAMPTAGTATYGGRMEASSFPTDGAVFTDSNLHIGYRGDVTLRADFANGGVAGKFTGLDTWTGSSGPYSPVSGGITFDATIIGNLITATNLSGTGELAGYRNGSVSGAFFGPFAEEAAGVFDASNQADKRVLRGWFGTAEDDDFGPANALESDGLLVGVYRNFTAETSRLQEDDGTARVERTADGWRVRIDGRTVDFFEPEYDDEEESYIKNFPDAEVWFWTVTRGFEMPSEFNHFDVKGWNLGSLDSSGNLIWTRDYFLHGNRTPDSAIPASGSATYAGRMEGAEFPSDDAIGASLRTRYLGDMTLTADFATAGVSGDIANLETRVGSGSYSPIAGGATFNAAINGNLFTASDLNGTGALAGYRNGNVRGAFFGTAAEEAAGVFDAHDQGGNKLLTGYFGTTKNDDSGPANALESDGLLVGVHRNLTAGTSRLREDDGMATVERTADGWRVTVNGRTVDFLESDYNDEQESYKKNLSDARAWFWTVTRGFQMTSEFNHFDVKGWNLGALDSSGDQIWTRDYILHGNQTPDSAIPTSGSATYAGRMEGAEFPTDDAVGSGLSARYLGDMKLTADFATAGVSGDISNLATWVGRGSDSPIAGGATFNATIDGNLFTASDLNGTGALAGYRNGNVRGAFFGTAAEEAAGVFDAHDRGENKLLTGYFGTTKNDE